MLTAEPYALIAEYNRVVVVIQGPLAGAGCGSGVPGSSPLGGTDNGGVCPVLPYPLIVAVVLLLKKLRNFYVSEPMELV